jgi:tetratricopeptide (TPR) repeat protein
LFLLYGKPLVALGRIVDQGRWSFAFGSALVVSILLHASVTGPRIPVSSLGIAVFLRFLSYEPGSWLFPLGCIVVALVPTILLVRAIAGFGSFGVLMESDYLALLNCVLISWAAAYLPLAIAGLLGLDQMRTLPVYVGANVYFGVLTALAVRTVFGTGFATAAGMTLVGWAGALLGGAAFAVAGSSLRFLMSPFLLYYLYLTLGSDLRSIGQGLRSRQHLRQQLEIATTNPRDADAHYQLGLIFQKRRQYSEAAARFSRAIEIDPREADAHFQLGRVEVAQAQFDDAIEHLRTAAGLDDKLATSEVWRELGAACFNAARLDEAEAALAKYTDRRPYDPEGLYWYGMTLLRLKKPGEARGLFERSIDAVKTMPANRRAQVRKWSTLARTELRALNLG